MRSQKIRLKLTKEQESLAWWFSKVSRNFWNLLVELDSLNNKGVLDDLVETHGISKSTFYSEFFQKDIYKLTDSAYLKLVREYVNSVGNPTFDWYYLKNQSFIYSGVTKEFTKVKRLNKGKVRFRSVDKISPSFPVRCDESSDKIRPSRIYLKSSGKLQIPTLGEVKLGKTRKDFDLSGKKQVAKVVFDGKYWYLTYTENVTDNCSDGDFSDDAFSDGVGIDLGIRTLVQVSDGTSFKNIKHLRRFRILNKRLKRLQRKLSRKYLLNKATKHTKTKNILKLERAIKLIYRSIKNIRINHIRELTAKIVKKRPEFIALEDLNVKGMMKNKHLARDIANCSFYTIREHLTRKSKEVNIAVRIVDRFYPSSKTCSNCGTVNKSLRLKDRVFSCSCCGLHIDRDLNASLNLKSSTEYKLA